MGRGEKGLPVQSEDFLVNGVELCSDGWRKFEHS